MAVRKDLTEQQTISQTDKGNDNGSPKGLFEPFVITEKEKYVIKNCAPSSLTTGEIVVRRETSNLNA